MVRLVLIIVGILFASCSIPLYYTESKKDALIYVGQDIKYKKDLFEFWQYPEETMVKGAGDCEDQSSLLCYLLEGLGYNPVMVAVQSRLSNGLHMIVYLDGEYIESVHGLIVSEEYVKSNYRELYRIDLKNYMTIARLMHPFD